MNDEQVARGLGWFSIGLGAAELLAPRQVGEAIGLAEDGHPVLQVMGLREIASGVGLLRSEEPAGWLWSRVAGDAIDLAGLWTALARPDTDRSRLGFALAAVAGVAALDVYCAARASDERERRARDSGVPRGRLERRADATRKSITVNRPIEDVYAFWRDFESFPRFMPHLKSVTASGNGRSHWVAKGPRETSIEWDAEITEEAPNSTIAWRSLPGADVPNSGRVRFERGPGGRGTVIRVEMEYQPPGGAAGAAGASLLGYSPGKQTEIALLRAKQLLETGEVARTEGQPAGRGRSTSRKYDDFLREGL